MKIIAGRFRNQSIITPKRDLIRPTTSRTRAAVFNMLQSCIENSRFLDICAGSGAMGFEALSRGACHVTFIENNRNVCAAIRKNSEHFNVQQQITLVTQDALVGLEMLIQRGEQFDIIYFDPPYNASFIAPVLHALDCSSLLASRGILLVEERQKWMQPLSFATLALISQRTFGDTVLREYVQADRISSL